METASFYQALDTDSHEIRLLRILPLLDNTERIDCLLETVSLEASPKYFGLSYEWEKYPPEQPHPKILVNSQEIPIKSNLALAIKQLSEFRDGRLFWIDALCINQNDDVERAQQVRMMTRIYANSSGVYTWLGLEEGNSDKAMDFVEEFDKVFPENLLKNNPDVSNWIKEKLRDASYQDYWDELCKICERSYWKRVWVIQEIVVVEDRQGVRLLCGSKHVRFAPLQALVFMAGSATTGAPVAEHFEPWFALSRKLRDASREMMFIARHAMAWGNQDHTEDGLGLQRLLGDHAGAKCSDLRDKVYALLGILLSYEGLELEISYSKSACQVFLDATQYIIRGSKRLDILIDRGEYSPELSDLPTWVPDRTGKYEDPAVICSIIDDYDACASTSANTKFSPDGRKLTAFGTVILGTVTEFNDGEWWGPNMEHIPSDVDQHQVARDELSRWLNFARRSILGFETGPTEHEGETFFLSPYELARAFYDAVIYTHDAKSVVLPFEKFLALCVYLCDLVPEAVEIPEFSEEDILQLYLALQETRKLCNIELSRPLLIGPTDSDRGGESSSGYESEDDSEDQSDNDSIYGSQSSQSLPANTSEQASENGLKRSTTSDLDAGSDRSSETRVQEYLTRTVGVCYPKRAKVNDIAVVVRGCKHPLLVRKHENGYELISELYVHGVMSGEAIGSLPEMDLELI